MAVALAGPALAQEQADASEKTFFESFDRLDPALWYVSDGWRNGAHQNCDWSARAVTLRDGLLVLSLLPAKDGADAQLCGEVQTRPVYHYGTYEARIRTGARSGMNAAFFTYIGPVHGQPHDEIDVELLTRDPGMVSLNAFVAGTDLPGRRVALPRRSDAQFADYAFVWEPDRLRWYQDGIQIMEITGSAVPKRPMKIYLSHWGTDTLTDWMGPFTPPDAAVEMEIDWLAYSAPGTVCAFEGSLTCAAP